MEKVSFARVLQVVVFTNLFANSFVVYFELIGCNDLPNMDAATVNLRDKTDAFGCIMFEDAIVNTDVVTDSLSPRWPPWCRRAFVFNLSHPTSDILLALFDQVFDLPSRTFGFTNLVAW